METTSEGLSNFLNHYGAIPTLVTAEAGEMPTKSQQFVQSHQPMRKCYQSYSH